MLKTIRLLCITVSAGRSRSVKNAADTKLPASTAMHKRRSKNQVGLNCNKGFGAQGCLSKAVLLKAVNNVHNDNNVYKLIMFIS